MPGPAQPLTASRVTIRLEFPDGSRVGHGKVALLEAIREHGSIAAAARLLGMSYPRALGLIAQVEGVLKAPVLSRSAGGSGGGGAVVTPAGEALLRHYRMVERTALEAAINNPL